MNNNDQIIMSKEAMKRFASEIMKNRTEVLGNRKIITDEVMPLINQIVPQIVAAFKEDISTTTLQGKKVADLLSQLEVTERQNRNFEETIKELKARIKDLTDNVDLLKKEKEELSSRLIQLTENLDQSVVSANDVDSWFEEDMEEDISEKEASQEDEDEEEY